MSTSTDALVCCETPEIQLVFYYITVSMTVVEFNQGCQETEITRVSGNSVMNVGMRMA